MKNTDLRLIRLMICLVIGVLYISSTAAIFSVINDEMAFIKNTTIALIISNIMSGTAWLIVILSRFKK